MNYVLGVDGGGTKTYAAIVTSTGQLLGEGWAGPSNYHDVGVGETSCNLAASITMASRQAGLARPQFAAAFLGLASVVSPEDRLVVREIASGLGLPLNERVGIDHDCRIALAGGLSGRPGIVQIAGTGASTYGRNAEGREWRSGGWAHLLSDEGSSYWFGLNAMKAAVRAQDGRLKGTLLQSLVMDRLGLVAMNDIMYRLYVTGMSRSEIASLCPLLIDAARTGDAVALSILGEGMECIAECIEAVARKLDFAPEADGETACAGCEVALVGGLFNAGEIILQQLTQSIGCRLTNCNVIYAEMPPVLGACLLALGCLGISADKPLVTELMKTSGRNRAEVLTL